MLANPYYSSPQNAFMNRDRLMSPQNGFSNAPYLKSSNANPSRNFQQEYQNEFKLKNPENHLPLPKPNPSYQSFYPPKQQIRQPSPRKFPINENHFPRYENSYENYEKRIRDKSPTMFKSPAMYQNPSGYPPTIKKRPYPQDSFQPELCYVQSPPQDHPLPNNMFNLMQRPNEFNNPEKYPNRINNQSFAQPDFFPEEYKNRIPIKEPFYNAPQDQNFYQSYPSRKPMSPSINPVQHPPNHLERNTMKGPPFSFERNEFPIERPKPFRFNGNTFDDRLETPYFSNQPPIREIRDDNYLPKPNFGRDDNFFEKPRIRDDNFNFKTKILNPYDDYSKIQPFRLPIPEMSSPQHNFAPTPKFLFDEPGKFGPPYGINTFNPPRFMPEFNDAPIIPPLNFPNYTVSPTISNFSSKATHFEEPKKMHIDKDLDEIADVFKEYIFFERSVQQSKEALCRRPDFKLIRLIKEFDDNETGQIVFEEFKNGLKKFGVKAEDADISLLINRYSRDGNNKFDYKEFTQMILPSSEINKSAILSKEGNIEKMSQETNKCVAHVFKMLLNCHYSCELIRKDLIKKKVNLQKAFDYIANLIKGKAINKEAVAKFFEKYYFYPAKEDLDNLMDIFDRNRTGLINLNEFEYELNPKLH